MRRKGLTLMTAAAVGLTLGVWLYSSRGQDGSRAPAQRTALGWEHSDLWPTSRAWVWNVDLVATKRRVRVCVRTTESKLPPGSSPAIPGSPELPAIGAEKHSGWSVGGDRLEAGRVTCQLIDFREAGLGEAVGGHPLRLLVRLRSGGSLLGLTGQNSVLPG